MIFWSFFFGVYDNSLIIIKMFVIMMKIHAKFNVIHEKPSGYLRILEF